MCYDISFTVNIRVLGDYFPDLVYDSQLEIEFAGGDAIQGVGVFPRYPILYYPSAKQKNADGKLHCKLMEWGVIRHRETQEPKITDRNLMLNIRSERVLGDPKSYWHEIRNRRCLIPVTGIFEHREIKGWKRKVPYWVRPAEQETFFLPGLYAVARIAGENGVLQERWTFGMMTRNANHVMRQIHNGGENRYRMVSFLPLEMAKEFLSDDLTEARYEEILAYEMPSESLIYRTTDSIRSRKPREDGKRKHEQKIWDKLPELGNDDPD